MSIKTLFKKTPKKKKENTREWEGGSGQREYKYTLIADSCLNSRNQHKIIK